MYGYYSGASIAHNDGSWDPAVLEPLAEINERVLEVLGVAGGQRQPYTSSLSPLLAAEWRSLDALRGRPARVLLARAAVEGIARGVDEDGGLLLEHGGNVDKFIGGEASLRLIPGEA